MADTPTPRTEPAMNLPICGKCERPILNQRNARHFGLFMAHPENECLAILKADLAAANEQVVALGDRLNDAATLIRVFGEEFVLAGFEAGDRTVTLAHIRKIIADNKALKAEAERNARDAERYREARRWHNPPMDTPFICILQNGVFTALTEEFADERLDAAIAQGK